MEIDMSMNWKQAVEIYLALLESGTEEGKGEARKGLRKLAVVADTYAQAGYDALEGAA